MAKISPEQRNPTLSDGDHNDRQFTLRGLFVATTIICIWFALYATGIADESFLIYLAPFFFALYVAHRFVLRALALAVTYFLIHSAACVITMALVLQEDDGTARWVASLPIVILDLPITFVVAFWEPPGILFPIYIFIGGGLLWAIIGWNIAQNPYHKTV